MCRGYSEISCELPATSEYSDKELLSRTSSILSALVAQADSGTPQARQLEVGQQLVAGIGQQLQAGEMDALSAVTSEATAARGMSGFPDWLAELGWACPPTVPLPSSSSRSCAAESSTGTARNSSRPTAASSRVATEAQPLQPASSPLHWQPTESAPSTASSSSVLSRIPGLAVQPVLAPEALLQCGWEMHNPAELECANDADERTGGLSPEYSTKSSVSGRGAQSASPSGLRLDTGRSRGNTTAGDHSAGSSGTPLSPAQRIRANMSDQTATISTAKAAQQELLDIVLKEHAIDPDEQSMSSSSVFMQPILNDSTAKSTPREFQTTTPRVDPPSSKPTPRAMDYINSLPSLNTANSAAGSNASAPCSSRSAQPVAQNTPILSGGKIISPSELNLPLGSALNSPGSPGSALSTNRTALRLRAELSLLVPCDSARSNTSDGPALSSRSPISKAPEQPVVVSSAKAAQQELLDAALQEHAAQQAGQPNTQADTAADSEGEYSEDEFEDEYDGDGFDSEEGV